MKKIRKLKNFLVLENDCFQSQESQQLSTNIRISANLFFRETPMKLITIQEISYGRNDKVKITVKTKLKTSHNFFTFFQERYRGR